MEENSDDPASSEVPSHILSKRGAHDYTSLLRPTKQTTKQTTPDSDNETEIENEALLLSNPSSTYTHTHTHTHTNTPANTHNHPRAMAPTIADLRAADAPNRFYSSLTTPSFSDYYVSAKAPNQPTESSASPTPPSPSSTTTTRTTTTTTPVPPSSSQPKPSSQSSQNSRAQQIAQEQTVSPKNRTIPADSQSKKQTGSKRQNPAGVHQTAVSSASQKSFFPFAHKALSPPKSGASSPFSSSSPSASLFAATMNRSSRSTSIASQVMAKSPLQADDPVRAFVSLSTARQPAWPHMSVEDSLLQSMSSSPNPFSQQMDLFPSPAPLVLVSPPSDSDSATVISSSSDDLMHRSPLLRDLAAVFDRIMLYGGEKPVASFPCDLLNDRKAQIVPGALYVTNYRVGFIPDESDSMTDSDRDYSTIPLGLIHCIEKLPARKLGTNVFHALEIICKDFRSLRFLFASDSQIRREAFQVIHKSAFPPSGFRELFAFSYVPNIKYSVDGWALFDPITEFKRMGVPTLQWRVSHANVGYKMSETYPELIAIPASISDEEIASVASFRSRGRIPALSWKHLFNQAAIIRCSQPLVGMSGKRNREDEKLFDAIAQATTQSKTLHIMDSRPRANAIGNQVKGAGYESTTFYKKMTISFMNIENIHVVRESYNKLRNVCLSYGSATADNALISSTTDQTQTSPYAHWYSYVDSTQWLTHIKTILFATAKLVRLIANGESVLIHCSDGWDRTAQQSSLAMLCLDPYYRTIEGFMVLIEKEWCNFGHKFLDRTGHGDRNHDDEDRSPIFLQFIDCVWQLTRQFPRSFQFNELFLVHILDHLYSCRFGTFLVNNERDNKLNNLKNNTVSLWSYLSENKTHYESKRYNGPDVARAVAAVMPPLIPNPHSIMVTIWVNYYLRWTVHAFELDIRLPSEFNSRGTHEGLLPEIPLMTPVGTSTSLFSQMLDLSIEELSPSAGDEGRNLNEKENLLLKEKMEQIEELKQQVKELRQEIETLNALNKEGALGEELINKQNEVVRTDNERASMGNLASFITNQAKELHDPE